MISESIFLFIKQEQVRKQTAGFREIEGIVYNMKVPLSKRVFRQLPWFDNNHYLVEPSSAKPARVSPRPRL